MEFPITDPIEYLLRRKFGFGRNHGAVLSSTERFMRKATPAQLQAFENYKAELEAKSPEAIRALYEAELAKHRSEVAAKVEREEQARFFNQPLAKADFGHWSKAAHWTLDEAIALSFGKAPEVVNWARLEQYRSFSHFAQQYARVRDLALRACRWEQLFDPVLPGIFLAWAQRTDIAVPPELVAAVKSRGVQVADWKTLYEKLSEESAANASNLKAVIQSQQTKIDELTAYSRELEAQIANQAAQPIEPTNSKDVSTRERDSLLKLVIGLAVGGYGYDPSQRRSDKMSEIAADLERAGVGLDVDTVRKWMREASMILPPKETE